MALEGCAVVPGSCFNTFILFFILKMFTGVKKKGFEMLCPVVVVCKIGGKVRKFYPPRTEIEGKICTCG